jgi:hypothetical protein
MCALLGIYSFISCLVAMNEYKDLFFGFPILIGAFILLLHYKIPTLLGWILISITLAIPSVFMSFTSIYDASLDLTIKLAVNDFICLIVIGLLELIIVYFISYAAMVKRIN